MARIEPRPKEDPKAWRLRWRLDGKRTGPWQSLTFDDEKKATKAQSLIEAHAHGLTADQLRAQLKPAAKVLGETVAQYCRRYVDSLVVESSTYKEYERTIRLHIEPSALGAIDLAAVTREDVRRWVKTMSDKGAAPKSVANHHAFLAAALGEALNEGLITRHPCKGVSLPRRDNHVSADDEMCFLTPQEVDLITKALPEKYRHIPWLLARTGLRWSEFTALQVGDVDLLAKPPTLSVRRSWKRAEKGYKLGVPKTRKSRRTIDLDSACVDLLLPLVAGKTKTEFVITTDGTKPLPHSTFDKAWGNALYGPRKKDKSRDGGLVGNGLLEKRPSIHDLRHTHASWLLGDPRVTPIQASRRLGHESIQTTFDIYGHVARSDGASIVTALDAIVSSQVDEATGSRAQALLEGGLVRDREPAVQPGDQRQD